MRNVIQPWILFIRNIPPLAYVPLIVMTVGVGRKPQVVVITIATFLTMCITIYQGVVNIDDTLIRAARVLGAKDKDIFVRVIAPASLPFILTAVRLGRLYGADHADCSRIHGCYGRFGHAHPVAEQQL